MVKAIITILIKLLTDKKSRDRTLLIIGSILVGFILLLAAPIIALYSLENTEFEAPEIDKSAFSDSDFISQLPSEKQEKIAHTQAVGDEIELEMRTLGIADQTIKAQLIYMSYFDEVENFDANFYAHLFYYSPNDEVLIDSLNQNYGLAIDYNDFMRTYIFIMNSTINKYMFTDTSTKNAADLAAWAENAYLSEWQYADNCFGERTGEGRLRCADNVGLIMGYIRYDAENKVFTSDIVDLYYTEQGSIDTMPDVKGVGVYNGSEFGVYVGGGEVAFSSAIGGVQRQALTDGGWTAWCTFDAVTYPQEVQDRINELHETTTEATNEETTGG
ncbi:MAG: hypothetical protein J6X85_07740 [Ruminococcus sp.]|nr:hypothetical protein [Ruminococcus sp.]